MTDSSSALRPAAIQRAWWPATRGHAAGFWLVAAAYFIAMAFNAVPTPLYPLYQARDGFGTATVTLVFGCFAFGVAAGLILLGHVSDWVGRKRILVPALILEVLAAAIFLAVPSLPGLLIGRLVGGLGVGMITGTATAHLQELHRRARPESGPGRFEVVSTGANVGGLAVGPLVAGALAQYVAAPLRVPYIICLVLLLAAIVAVAATPETVKALPSRPSYRPQAVSFSHGDSVAMIAAAAAGFAAFSINGVYTSLSAGFLAGTLGYPSHLLAGAVAFALLAAATAAQLATNRLTPTLRRGLGLGGGVIGLMLLAIGVQTASLTVFVLAGVIAGAGSGILIKSAIGTTAEVARPDKRGEALSGLFLICYAGMSLPAIGVGIAVQYVSLTTAMHWLCGGLLLILLGTARLSRPKVDAQ